MKMEDRFKTFERDIVSAFAADKLHLRVRYILKRLTEIVLERIWTRHLQIQSLTLLPQVTSRREFIKVLVFDLALPRAGIELQINSLMERAKSLSAAFGKVRWDHIG